MASLNLEDLASASWFWPRPWPQPESFGLGLGVLASFNITAIDAKILKHTHLHYRQEASLC